jgi:DnaJ-class molecular chaperone
VVRHRTRQEKDAEAVAVAVAEGKDKVFISDWANAMPICSRCQGCGLFKGDKCGRCKGNGFLIFKGAVRCQ